MTSQSPESLISPRQPTSDNPPSLLTPAASPPSKSNPSISILIPTWFPSTQEQETNQPKYLISKDLVIHEAVIHSQSTL
ncbi:hypothetical protein DSO57_1016016 [Entomophthora muscae]|uniref:Uncharacterized protein n=1 Tax=Entomophthora muscae TaxID=34485 RepID=A0ACC2TG94_9FUNG|nr:hypothetical protein DSO57_1016016 [Entomophthora muscae]